MNIPKVKTTRPKKRLGRGTGSGKGNHTVGRGVKGQKARRKIHILFEGVKVKKSLLHRLPVVRGKAKFKSRARSISFNLKDLDVFPDNAQISLTSLVEKGLLDTKTVKTHAVKLLGSGNAKKGWKVSLSTSSSAAAKIIKQGGEVK